MSANSAKPKDITGSLVHYKKAAPRAGNTRPSKNKQPKSKWERKMAFDGLTFTMWSTVAALLSSQCLLMLALSYL